METSIELLEPPAADDAALVQALCSLINDVYATAESGLWRDGSARTTPDEVAGLIRDGQIVVARRGEHLVGSVQIHDVAGDASEFGMLVSDPEQRNLGIGRALLDFAEQRGRERGLRAMQLELLIPRGWKHPSKEFLKDWYGRRGYRRVRTTSIQDSHPHLAPLLATTCDLEIHQKPLRAEPSTAVDDRA